MAKVVTSEGLQDFVATGKPTETIANDQTSKKLSLANKLAVVDAPADKAPEAAKPPEEKPKEGTETKPLEEDTGLEPEDHDLAERAKKRIGKKHYEMKKAQEEAREAREQADSDSRLAETLFNEREMWKKRAEELEQRLPKEDSKPKEPESKKPDINDPKYKNETGQFDWQKYSEDLATYAAKAAVSEDRENQAKEARKREQEAADAAARARVAKAKEKYSDWERVVATSDIQIQNECLRFMAESEYGTDIAYFLAKHPKDAERIRSMSPYLAVAELGKLQTQFEKPADPPAQAASKTVEPAAPAARGAPAPITPISTSGSGTVQLDPAKMNFKELRAYERERARNRR